MLRISLSGSPRENVGKKDAKAVRREGLIPCVIYGKGEQTHFTVDAKDFDKLLFTPNVYIIELNIDGKERLAVIQDLQYHPVEDDVLHIDFLEVDEENPVKVALPIKITGASPGVMRGGKLVTKIRRLRVKGLIANLPEVVTLDISELEIGQGIKVKDIKMENIEFLNTPNAIIVGVKMARGASKTAEEEAED
ncbi:MAG: 50S ribosomal protein L25/general stress protein Ctc [Bacteroidales bacterium]